MNDAQRHRPVTSKARGICKYHLTPRGCFAGNTCKFLHISESDVLDSRNPALTPYDEAKRCKYYANGYCKRGEKCWFLHVIDTVKEREEEGEIEDQEDEFCSVCFEKPVTFGLLDGCSHIFCLQCIRQWRDPSGKLGDVIESGNTKRCPMCRTSSRYIIPSSRFWKGGQNGKSRAIQNYKESMSKVPCKHFKESKAMNPSKPLCPFGKECFYQHLNDDGSPHILKRNASASMRLYRMQMGRPRAPFSFETFSSEQDIPFPLDFDGPRLTVGVGQEADVNAVSLAGNIAIDMFDRMVAEVMSGATERRGSRGRRGRRLQGANDRMVDQETLDRARRRMMAGAVTAIRAELSRLDQPRTDEDAGPIVVPGVLHPTEWDLDADLDSEGVDTGWEWNGFLTEAGINGETDVMERLEILADHMLGSLQVLGSRDTGTPPPPLEPIGEEATPPERNEVNDGDDMPTLGSASNSSYNEGRDVQDSDSEQARNDEEVETERVVNTIQAFDLLLNGSPRDVEGSGVFPLFCMWDPPVPLSASDTSSRFSTVVGREDDRARMYIDVEEGDEDDNQGGEKGEEGETVGNTSTENSDVAAGATQPPPFVTDGRGRVVWSNKSSETAETSTLATTGSAEPPADDNTAPRTLLGRMFDALF